MTLQTSGPISLDDINVELGRAAGSPITLNDPDVRALAGIPSGPISLQDFYGASTFTPWLIDSMVLHEKVLGSSLKTSSNYGFGFPFLSFNGSIMAVGAEHGSTLGGGAYTIYEKDGNGDFQELAYHGSSVSQDYLGGVGMTGSDDGNLIVCGARARNAAGGAQGAGTGVILTRNGSTYDREYIDHPNPGPDYSYFGEGMGCSHGGDVIVWGAPGDHSNFGDSADIANCGRAYLYKKVGATWTLSQTIDSPIQEQNAFFGRGRIYFTKDDLMMTICESNSRLGGAIHIYERPDLDTDFTLMFTIDETVSPSLSTADSLGNAGAPISHNGNVISAGAYRHNDVTDPNNTIVDKGAVFVFERSGNTWSETAVLTSPLTDSSDRFGYYTEMDSTGTVILGGSYLYDTPLSNAGLVVLFTKGDSGTWTVGDNLQGSLVDSSYYFGSGIAISGDNKVITLTAYGDDDNGTRTGATYVYDTLE